MKRRLRSAIVPSARSKVGLLGRAKRSCRSWKAMNRCQPRPSGARETPQMRSWRNLIASSRPEQGSTKASPRVAHPGKGWSLGFRLLVWVGFALLPPAALIVMQGIESARHDAADERDQLITAARDAAMPTANAIASAKQVALALS